MPIVKTEDLRIGMMVCENVYTKAKQLIVQKDALLSRQMISHIKFYEIKEVNVYDGDMAIEIREAYEHNDAHTSQLERILQSQEYKIFKKEYTENVSMLKNTVSDIVLRNTPIDPPSIIDNTVKIFEQNQGYFSFLGMLHSMKQIDDSTFAHSVNVAMIARLIGLWSGFDNETLDLLTLAGLLHDIGKCQIPDDILMKPRKLTPQEFGFVKMHTQFGFDILRNQNIDSRVKNAALYHHERCDGSGYPAGLVLTQLGDFECIISIADIYDAMTADRCYRSGLCPFEVISFFEEDGLQKYHPKYIKPFLRKIADTYVNSDVLLSNGETARIIYVNDRLTRPLIQLHKDNSFLNLLERPDIYIQAII